MDHHTLPLNFQLNNKYIIKKVLGQGGFGITYLAEDTLLDIEVCIKELFISGSSTRGSNMTVLTQNMKEFTFADFKERFIQEAKQLARFNHPNIVRVIEFFEANNTAYVVMEYIAGQTLKDKVAFGGPLSADVSQKIIESILDAVEVVHKAGMLHRDIKPDNLIIGSEGRIVLIDFGSARAYSDEKTIAQTAMVSPGYAPLEQYNPNARKGTFTDIYSIGATFYFMLTGEKPLNVTERYTERQKAPHEINPSVSMQVSSAVMLAMEMKAEDRFQNVADFRLGLKQLATVKKPVKKAKSTNDQVETTQQRIETKKTIAENVIKDTKPKTEASLKKEEIQQFIKKLEALLTDKFFLNETNIKKDYKTKKLKSELDLIKSDYIVEIENSFKSGLEGFIAISSLLLILAGSYAVWFNIPSVEQITSFQYTTFFTHRFLFVNVYYDIFSKIGLTLVVLAVFANISEGITSALNQEKTALATRIKNMIEKEAAENIEKKA
jgi:serine/threonine protein kinase